MRNSQSNSPILVYSLNVSMALDLCVAIIIFVVAIYYVAVYGAFTGAFILGALFLLDFYLRLWRRQVRNARFFEDHFEISGRNVNLRRVSYDEVENLTKTKTPFGDFRTDSSVWFSIDNSPYRFVIPNRKNRKVGVDLYSLILAKTPPRNHDTQ